MTYTSIDACGQHHPSAGPDARIASLVPSLSELLFALGLGTHLVARTHYCIHPAAELAAVPSVGGTKKINHRRLAALAPTHVLLNIDENTQELSERLAAYVPQRIVTHPCAPQDNFALYRLLGRVFGREAQAEALCAGLQQRLERLDARSWPSRRVLYLIWREPWMSVGADTYIARMLERVGWQTWPRPAAVRYPQIEITPQLLAEVDLVLFSSEPYRFTAADLEHFAATTGCAPHRLRLIDGEMTSWYGNRALAGVDYLHDFAAACA